MNIAIRTATTADAAAVADLSAQLGYPLSVSVAADYISTITSKEDELIYVAEQNGIVIAWIQISFLMRLESGPFFEIVGLVVDEQYRGKGIGKLLVEKGKEWCRSKGDYRLRVRSNVKRTAAHQFYLNNGFSELKEQKVFEWKM